MFRALAHLATQRSKRTVAAALLIFIAAALAGSSVADQLEPALGIPFLGANFTAVDAGVFPRRRALAKSTGR